MSLMPALPAPPAATATSSIIRKKSKDQQNYNEALYNRNTAEAKYFRSRNKKRSPFSFFTRTDEKKKALDAAEARLADVKGRLDAATLPSKNPRSLRWRNESGTLADRKETLSNEEAREESLREQARQDALAQLKGGTYKMKKSNKRKTRYTNKTRRK